MDDLKDYRVSQWMENGLMKRIQDTFKSIPIAVAIVGASLCFSASASNLDFVNSDPSIDEATAIVQIEAQLTNQPAMVIVRELETEFAQKLANFSNPDHSDLDADLLAYAQEAVVMMDRRQLQ